MPRDSNPAPTPGDSSLNGIITGVHGLTTVKQAELVIDEARSQRDEILRKKAIMEFDFKAIEDVSRQDQAAEQTVVQLAEARRLLGVVAGWCQDALIAPPWLEQANLEASKA